MLIICLILPTLNCQKHDNILSDDEIEVYNLVFSELQENLNLIPPPPPEEFMKMDSFQIDKYWKEGYIEMRKNLHDVYILFNGGSIYSVSLDSSLMEYNELLNEEPSKKKFDSLAIFKCLKPFDNHHLYIADENFRFDSEYNQKKCKSLISFSRLLVNDSLALIECGLTRGPLNGGWNLVFFKKNKRKMANS